MNSILKNVLAVGALAVATHASAQITFYEREGFEGRSFTTEKQIGNFEQNGFNDRASSAVVLRGRWEICEDTRFAGRCVVLRPGRYPSLATMNLNNSVSSVRMVPRNVRDDDNQYAPAPAIPQITFYEREGFAGRSFTTGSQIGNLQRQGFNDVASSVVVVLTAPGLAGRGPGRGRLGVRRVGGRRAGGVGRGLVEAGFEVGDAGFEPGHDGGDGRPEVGRDGVPEVGGDRRRPGHARGWPESPRRIKPDSPGVNGYANSAVS